ncbi:uncharacterized protein [Atheta coriaria]|uniref:uncharacterized protein n=1 Tax=Dalotia coriaria TaxID=877792 RepID=UPI0031F479A3
MVREHRAERHRRTASVVSGRSFETGEDAAAALGRATPPPNNGNNATAFPMDVDNIEFIDQDPPEDFTKKSRDTRDKKSPSSSSSTSLSSSSGNSGKKKKTITKNTKTTTETKKTRYTFMKINDENPEKVEKRETKSAGSSSSKPRHKTKHCTSLENEPRAKTADKLELDKHEKKARTHSCSSISYEFIDNLAVFRKSFDSVQFVREDSLSLLKGEDALRVQDTSEKGVRSFAGAFINDIIDSAMRLITYNRLKCIELSVSAQKRAHPSGKQTLRLFRIKWTPILGRQGVIRVMW